MKIMTVEADLFHANRHTDAEIMTKLISHF